MVAQLGPTRPDKHGTYAGADLTDAGNLLASLCSSPVDEPDHSTGGVVSPGLHKAATALELLTARTPESAPPLEDTTVGLGAVESQPAALHEHSACRKLRYVSEEAEESNVSEESKLPSCFESYTAKSAEWRVPPPPRRFINPRPSLKTLGSSGDALARWDPAFRHSRDRGPFR
jgi:hypothetical protein